MRGYFVLSLGSITLTLTPLDWAVCYLDEAGMAVWVVGPLTIEWEHDATAR